MPPEHRDPTNPDEWLRRARSNLARAKAHHRHTDILLEDLCFDAQQATEKALKAILVQRQIPFPKTHSISDLLTLLQDGGIDVPAAVCEAAVLTEYAVEARYPGVVEDVTSDDYEQAVALAERVVAWVVSTVSAMRP